MVTGALLSALQIVLGLTCMATGVGYGLYLQILAPILMTLMHLKCGLKMGLLAACNTIGITFICLGNGVAAIYLVQALCFGVICGEMLQKESSLMEDLLVASLLACCMLLILDHLTASLIGTSLLDEDNSLFVSLFTGNMAEAWFYMTIAAVPIATVLFTYIGSLILGKRLGLLNQKAYQKYKMLRFYPYLARYMYYSKKESYLGAVGILGSFLLGQWVKWPYLKAWLMTSCIVLLYFVLQDALKLVGEGTYQWLGKKLIVVQLVQLLFFIGFVVQFKWAVCSLLLVSFFVDHKWHIREQQTNYLNWQLKHRLSFYKVRHQV